MKLPKIALAVAAVALIAGLTACQPTGITGPTGTPLVIAASSETPTSDLLGNNYRRSITETGNADGDLYDTFYNANDLATANDGEMLAVMFSDGWYNALSVPSGSSRATFAGQKVAAYLPTTGTVKRRCNAVFIDTSIPTAGRTAIYNMVQGAGQYQAGALYQYRTYAADPGNELLTYADLCFSEGV